MSYFIWLIAGVVALVVEMMLPTFFFLFAGMGFIAAAAVAFFFPDSLFVQLLVASVFMLIGAIVFKKRRIGDEGNEVVGTHNEFTGIEGIVQTPLSEHREGEVELFEPVVGSRSWLAVTNGGTMIPGETVRIVAVRGNTLVVEKVGKGE